MYCNTAHMRYWTHNFLKIINKLFMHKSLAIPGRGTPGLEGKNFTELTGIKLFLKIATLQKPVELCMLTF